MDISSVSDGWSYSRNPGRFPGRSGQRFPVTATSPAKSGRSHGPTNRTPQSRGRDEPHRLVIKTSSVSSPHYSIRRMSPLTLTLGSALSSPSSLYCLPHVQMRTRRSLQPNNSVALPASCGIIIMLCSLPVMSSLGTSFGPLFERITSPKERSMNF
jgi:hypothetical protein